MKKKFISALGIVGIALASLLAAQPASADGSGTWRPYTYSSMPSNWHCGSTVSGPKLSMQSCVVRSGAYVQAATIVKNRTNALAPVNANQSLWNTGLIYVDGCPASAIGANATVVCFTATVVSSAAVKTYSTLDGAGYNGDYLSASSPDA